MAKKDTKSQIKVTLVKSTIGSLQVHKDTIAALGLRKIGQTKIHNEVPTILGMVDKVKHLIKVEKA